MNEPQYFPLSESALTISFEHQISIEINRKILELARHIEQNPFNGLVEIVPAYSSLTFFYDLPTVRKTFPTSPDAFSAVRTFAEKALKDLSESIKKNVREIEIIFDCGDEFAPDLEFISRTKNLSKTQIIEIFTARTYSVFMLGFLPGFAYMGEVDERIAVPRKQSPRLKVPKGSVGIAGNQTGIYPLESPGGWQIIGRTETELFTPNEKNPAFFQAGDMVKFIAE